MFYILGFFIYIIMFYLTGRYFLWFDKWDHDNGNWSFELRPSYKLATVTGLFWWLCIWLLLFGTICVLIDKACKKFFNKNFGKKFWGK